MSGREKKETNRVGMSAAQLRERFSIEDAAQSLILRVNGDPSRLPAQVELDTMKADLNDQCDREMAALAGPFMVTLKQVPVDLKNIYIAVDSPAEITAKLRRELRLLKRETERVLRKLEEEKQARKNEMNGLVATWRPSRPYRCTDRRKLMWRTAQLGAGETLINGAMLYTAQYKGGLLAAVAASVLPSIINLGGGAFLGDVLLRHIRRENANWMARTVSWKGICLLLSLVCSVNVGFAYLRVTGSVEGLIQYVLTGKLDYTVPAIAGLGLLLFAWATVKWWYSAHPNLQIEKLGRGLEELETKVDCESADLESNANAAVRKASNDISLLEVQEGDDVSDANDEFGELVLLISQLNRKLDEIQKQYEEATNDYSRMIFDALGPCVPPHYKQRADLSAARPGMPDISSLKALIDQLEKDYRHLRESAAAARCALELEPARTLGWSDPVGPIVPVGNAAPGPGAARARPASTSGEGDEERQSNADVKGLPATVGRREAAE